MWNFQKRFEEIKNKRNILSHTVPQRISQHSEEKARKWWTNHKCFLDESNWERDLDLDCLYPTIRLTPCSIASKITAICPFCGESKDVSDYETW